MLTKSKNTTAQVKKNNIKIITATLKEMEIATCAEISRECKLSIATCRNILNDLVKNKEVLEGNMDNESGGRPAKTYKFNKDFQIAMGITLDKNGADYEMTQFVFNLSGELCHQSSQTLASMDIETICSSIEEELKSYPHIASVCIGIPGFIDKDGVIIRNDIKELNGVALKKVVEDRFEGIKCTYATSPEAIAYGYYKTHPEAKGIFACIYTPKNELPGSAFIIGEKVYKGANNLAGEIAYMYYGKNSSSYSDMTEEDFIESLSIVATGITTIINPDNLLFTGRYLTEETYEKALANIKSPIKQLNPNFIYQQDSEDLYFNGVMQIAIDNMHSDIYNLEF